MLRTLANAWKIADIRKKILFTALILAPPEPKAVLLMEWTEQNRYTSLTHPIAIFSHPIQIACIAGIQITAWQNTLHDISL